MCSNVPYTLREMEIIHAIYTIDKHTKFRIKDRIETRQDYLYGAITWEDDYLPIPWNQVEQKIDEQRQEKRPY
jgi:hypothetical protein